jgi:glutaredoxin
MNYLLLTTTSCPKCPAMKEFIHEKLAGVSGEILDETSSNFIEEIQKYGVTVAPVLLIFKDEKEIFRGSEICEVEDFLSTPS